MDFKIWIIVPVFILLFFWYCTIAPLTQWEDISHCLPTNTNTTTSCEAHYSLPADNVDMVSKWDQSVSVSLTTMISFQYKWNGICLLPGLLLYILRYFWRLYWHRQSGIKNRPVPGLGITICSFCEMIF